MVSFFFFFFSSFLEIRFTLMRIWIYVLLPFLSFGPVFYRVGCFEQPKRNINSIYHTNPLLHRVLFVFTSVVAVIAALGNRTSVKAEAAPPVEAMHVP